MTRYLLAIPFILAGFVTTANAADREHPINVTARDKDHRDHQEFRMHVTLRDGRYYGHYNNREYILRGDAVTRFSTDGEYVVVGDINPDATYIETHDLRPTQFRMRITRRGDRYIGFYNNREYVLHGDAVRHYTTDGEYVVHGEIGTDGVTFETRELTPAVVVEAGPREFRMRVTRRGDRYIGFYNNREYVLRGDAVTHYRNDGEYVVRGEITADGTYIETRELAPVATEERVIVREQPVIIERREPLIKIGPLEIGR